MTWKTTTEGDRLPDRRDCEVKGSWDSANDIQEGGV